MDEQRAAAFVVETLQQPARQEKLFSLFFQNDIRLTEKLKLNIGLRWDYLWAGLCLLGAVYFMFRSS